MPRSTRDAEFSAFVREGRSELLRYARLLSAGDTHRAEDLVQTALARLYVAWPRVSRSGTALPYVRRIIVNAHIDETRRPRWRRERSVPETPDLPEPGTSGPWPSQAWSADTWSVDTDEVTGETVRAALADLPPRMRAVVVLRHWLDLSVEESADLLGCSQGTVKSQTAKAVERMRAALIAEPALRFGDRRSAEITSTTAPVSARTRSAS
jgi:RNA polymerase sigma-70 factor (sigma-E family)